MSVCQPDASNKSKDNNEKDFTHENKTNTIIQTYAINKYVSI